MQSRQSKALWKWCVHGVSSKGGWTNNEQEFFTECLWCLGHNKLYINPFKGQGVYQCKVCSQQGNYLTFLKEVHKLNKSYIKDPHWAALAEDRNLPVDALKGWDIGWNGEQFTVPTFGIEGDLIGLDLYKPGNKLIKSPGTTVGLINAHKLKDHLYGPIYLCEGFWDTISMAWLLKELKLKGIAVGVPGANISILPWEIYFYDKQVIGLYDNDPAGIEGEFKAYQILSTKTRALSFVHWPEKKAVGFDVRDHIVKYILEPQRAYDLIKKWLQPVPRRLENYAIRGKEKVLEQRMEKLKPITYQELVKKYQDFLYLPNTDPIKVMLGTVYANRFRSDMIWMFLVAPPSNGKSELILSLDQSPEIEHVSNVSEHTFVSGYIGAGGSDPSLFERLRNRIMAVKDFTPILSAPEMKQEAVMGVLRDAYDGRVDSMYGHTTNRRYKDLHFGIIAGVTGVVEKFGLMQATLGERFLRYYFPIDPKNQQKIQERANSNIHHEPERRAILKHAVLRFLETNKGSKMPTCPPGINQKIMNIACFTAALRGVVPRDWKERIQYHPSHEGPARVTKQLTLMGLGMACLEKKEEVGMEELRLVREIAIGTCPDRTRTIIKVLHDAGQAPMTHKDLETHTTFNVRTLQFVLDDLRMLGLIKRSGAAFKSLWSLTDHSKALIKAGNIYPEVKKRFIV